MENPHDALINAYKSYVDNVHFFQTISLDAMRAETVGDFLDHLQADAQDRFQVDHVHVLVGGYNGDAALDDLHPALLVASNAIVANYRGDKDVQTRAVATSIVPALASFNGHGSEAVLNVGPEDSEFEVALLLTSEDPKRFVPDQSTDLIDYYRNVVAVKIAQWIKA